MVSGMDEGARGDVVGSERLVLAAKECTIYL